MEKTKSIIVFTPEYVATIQKYLASISVSQFITEQEFTNFIEIAKSLNLNPFLKEIFIVKYKKEDPASIIIARDGYRKNAVIQPDYDSHYAIAIFENDKIDIIKHEPVITTAAYSERGRLIGAISLLHKKGSTFPVWKRVALDEYIQKTREGEITKFWKKQIMMIEKVAEAQCVKMAYPNVFAGTYDESELWEQEESKEPLTLQKSDDPLKSVRSKNIIELYNYAHELATLKNGDVFDEIAEKSKKGDWFISKEMFLDLENQLKTDTKGLWLKAIDYTTSQLAKALQDKKGA